MTGIAAVAMCAAFTSCSKDADFEQMNPEQNVLANYEAAFIKAFGQPAADQDWGFGSRQLPASLGTVTRGASTNGNQWEGNGYTIPADISQDELNAVLRVFNQKGEARYTSLIDWDEYFVQQVYKGVATYKNHDGGTVTGSEHMDWLCTVTNKYVNVKCWWPYQEEIVTGDNYDDHINNFNNGNAGGNWTSEASGKPVKKMMLMVNTDSHTFGFKSSEDNGHVFYNFRMEYIAPYGYFVGFDFEAAGQNKNEQVDRDYIYNDWIVKIVPGKGVTPPNRYTVRIICEDLMANSGSDFDFNDVVFDASYTEGSNKTTVTVQCAGGTLPLFVAGHEVHEEFAKENPTLGITTKTMINTNAAGVVGEHVDGLTPVSFEIDHIVAPWDIQVAVMVNNNNIIPLKADVQHPTAKIAVDPDFVWCNERDDIREVYPNFPNYVQDTNVNWY